MRTLPALVALLALSAAAARAATVDDAVLRLLPGERVAVRTPANEWTTGAFVTNRNDSLYLRRPSGTIALSYGSIAGLRARQNQRREGMSVGMLAGGVSLAFLSGSNSGSTSDAIYLGMGGIIVGGFVGGLIGAATHRWKDVYDENSALAATTPLGRRPSQIGARVGYVTSTQPSNQGPSASLIALPGIVGLEISYFPLPADDAPPPTLVYFTSDVRRAGGTLELHLVTHIGPRSGPVRPGLRLGVGPTIDLIRFDRYQGDGFGNLLGVSRVSDSEFRLGLDASPGVRFGSRAWSFAVEGTYHVVGGRGEYSDFYGILLGVSRE